MFEFTIPYEQKPVVTPVADSAADNNDAALPGILIVEDDVNMLDFIATNFRGEVPSYFLCSERNRSFKILEAQPVELILSDVMMPEMDGITLCQKVKNNIDFSHIPVILLTAKGNNDTELQGIESWRRCLCSKAFKWKHITALVKTLETRSKLKKIQPATFGRYWNYYHQYT